jgi:hypothetical protein
MGLDNGIHVKRTPESERIPEMTSFDEDWRKKYGYDFEVCYWRKCWNVRSRIFDVLTGGFDDKYRIVLTIEDIDKIIEVLKSFTPDNWQDEWWSIWTFEEMEDVLKQQIQNLGVLKRLMQEYELEVYFYDSY